MKKRFAFIDLHRGWVLLLMIETHVFNSMLMPQLKDSGWFSVLTFINGLVAPSFIFISGFAFNIASERKIIEFRKFGFQFWKQLGRIFIIWLAGYSLHLPYLSLNKMRTEATEQQLLNFFNVDVLQCIAAGLFFLFIIRILVKSEKAYHNILNVSFLLILIASPYLWNIELKNYMPVFIADYFTPKYGSLFPVFPWIGFMIAGAICSRFYMVAREKDTEKRFINSLVFSFLGLAIVSFILMKIKFLADYQPDPFFFLLRLGLVVLLLSFFWYFEQWRRTEKSLILDVSRESLLVYWLHLQFIYREFWNQTSLNSLVNNSLDILEAGVVTVILSFIMIITANYWGILKSKYPETIRYLIIGIVLSVIILFFFN